MGHLKLYLFALLAFLSITEGYSKGYYLDKKNNVVEIPLYKLPLYLRNESVMGVATYFPQMNKTGWHFLQISTNKNYPDYKQMYAAGFLEGSLTYDAIWDAWNNFNEFQLNNESQLSPGAQAFVNNQTQWLREIAERRPEDDFWELVNSTFTQQIGMYDGYIAKIKEANRPDMHLSFDQLYFLTNMGDLEDIIPAYNISAPQYMECSALIRLIGDDIIIAHNTFNLFSLMLRVFKSYTIPLNNPLVKVKTLMFSSRPGDLESKDDFYVLDSRLVVLETSLNNYNRTLYDHFSPKTLPSWLRHLVANRMATDGNHWAELFFRNRSGTHNNQWLVVDYNKLEQYKGNLAQAEGIVTMVEEFYNLESAIDVTQELLIPQGYVAGYNVPYNKSIYDESGYAKNYSYNYSNDPRAVLFKKYAPDVKDVNSAKHLIRHNNPKDTNDICSAISPRCDLLEKGPYIFGAIDGKVTNKFMVQNMLAWVVSGPTNQNHPAFDWSKWPNTAKRGMPTVFNFDWLLYRAQLGPFIPHNKTISE